MQIWAQSKNMKELDKFEKIAKKVKATKEKFAAELWQHMINCNKLEYQQLMKKCHQKFVKNLWVFMQNILTFEEKDNNKTDKTAISVIKKWQSKMLHHLDTNLDSIKTIYKGIHSLTKLPTPMDISIPTQLSQDNKTLNKKDKDNSNDNSGTMQPLVIQTNWKNDIAKTVKTFAKTMFITSIFNLKKAIKDKEKSSS